MQDELTKHGLKLYKTMADRKHSFGEKFKEILIEIGIIVFAVSLSIWFHNWSEHHHEQKEVKEFLLGLRHDLSDDIRVLKENCDTITTVDSNFTHAFSLHKNQLPDSIVHHYFYYSMVVTNLNNARYEGFKSSGKIGNIEDDSLREAILVYYQQTVPAISDHETIVNKLQEKLLDYQIDNSNISINEFLAMTKTKGILQLSMENLNFSTGLYANAMKQAASLISSIDNHTK